MRLLITLGILAVWGCGGGDSKSEESGTAEVTSGREMAATQENSGQKMQGQGCGCGKAMTRAKERCSEAWMKGTLEATLQELAKEGKTLDDVVFSKPGNMRPAKKASEDGCQCATGKSPRNYGRRRMLHLAFAYDDDGEPGLSDQEMSALLKDATACCEKRMARMIEEVDANKDGRLDPSEHRAAREARQERRKAKMAKFDTNGDGQLSMEERSARHERHREMMEEEAAVDLSNGMNSGERARIQETIRAHVNKCEPRSEMMGEE